MTRRVLSIAVCVAGMGLAASTAAVQTASRDHGAVAVSLWEPPQGGHERDLLHGPWGARLAPNPDDVYTLAHRKRDGVNPGVIVTDSRGRTWHVKQPRYSRGDEGPVEVVISRVLSAIGYHQPPVYYLPSFTMREGSHTHVVRGGRFRLSEPSMKSRGEWYWKDNPFVATQP